jgi:hypothetical protein
MLQILLGSRGRAELELTPQKLVLRLKPFYARGSSASLVKNASFLPQGLKVSSLGLAVTVEESIVELSTTTPESLIRLDALAAGGSVLAFPEERVWVQLEGLGDAAVRPLNLYQPVREPGDWLRLPMENLPPFELPDLCLKNQSLDPSILFA